MNVLKTATDESVLKRYVLFSLDDPWSRGLSIFTRNHRGQNNN